ncbi:hypothetical protein [Achromobacter spanius]|uniref:hypothetical protein n=1 Tax=Achromobacter spanius TaxID=217203 RepID=UPI00380C6393
MIDRLIRALSVIVALSGCGASPLLNYEPTSAATVTLPLAQAGIEDRREEFSRVFAQELRQASDFHQFSDPARWLHNVNATKLVSTESLKDNTAIASSTSVLIVPGIFGDCVGEQSLPFSDGMHRKHDNAVAGYYYLKGLGLASIRALPVRGRATSDYNSEIVAHEILAEAAAPHIKHILLLGYSKGVPDALQGLALLHDAGQLPGKVAALISVAGVVMGTPIADAMQSHYAVASPWLNPLTCTESKENAVHSLTRATRGRWMSEKKIPPGIRTYSLVAHADSSEISPGLRFSHRELRLADPRNDGQVLMTDAILPNSALLAEAKSDHWTFVLPLAQSNVPAVRALANSRSYPRAELFSATIRIVLRDLHEGGPHH